MKKIIALVLALMLALSLVACGGNNETPNTNAPEQTETPEQSDPVEKDIDLGAFYNDLYNELYPLDAEGWPTGPYADDWATPEMMEGLEMFYTGLTAIETEQMHVYVPAMTAVAYEVALIKVANESDVDAVKAILQARIDSQISNQMNYPMVIEGWQNDARIVSNGKYVMLAVGTDCDTFVERFNAQF